MNYNLQEGKIEVPAHWQDSTLNVLQATSKDGLSFVINRDKMPKGEDPNEYLAAQWKIFPKELNGFKRLGDLPINNPAFYNNTAMEYKWESPEGIMYQINALHLQDSQMMSFTFTTAVPWSESVRQNCITVLNSFRLRPKDDNPQQNTDTQ